MLSFFFLMRNDRPQVQEQKILSHASTVRIQPTLF